MVESPPGSYNLSAGRLPYLSGKGETAPLRFPKFEPYGLG